MQNKKLNPNYVTGFYFVFALVIISGRSGGVTPISVRSDDHKNKQPLRRRDDWGCYADGESSFSVSIAENKRFRTGCRIIPVFTIELHSKDLALLKHIQSFPRMGGTLACWVH